MKPKRRLLQAISKSDGKGVAETALAFSERQTCPRPAEFVDDVARTPSALRATRCLRAPTASYHTSHSAPRALHNLSPVPLRLSRPLRFVVESKISLLTGACSGMGAIGGAL